MSDKRRGLGRGLGALIPDTPTAVRPVDVFFPPREGQPSPEEAPGSYLPPAGSETPPGPGPAERMSFSTPAEPADGEGVLRAAVEDRDDLLPVPGARFAEVPVSDITVNPRQPRQVFDEEAMEELASSIREVGVLQPVVVRPLDLPAGGARYELVMGERRWRASILAGMSRVPAIVRQTGDDVLLRDALLENLHRSQLNPLEEAAAYAQLLEDFGCTQEELAARIGRSRPQVSNTIRLLRLPSAVQRRVAAGVLSAGHARALLGLADPVAMERLAARVVAEGLSVRATEEVVTLGGDAAPRPAVERRAPSGPGPWDDMADRLADRLDTRVTITVGRNKGRLTVEFAGEDDLQRILGALLPERASAEEGIAAGT